MSVQIVTALLALMPLTAACVPSQDPDVPARYGLAQATAGREIMEEAIVLVDAILPADFRMRLSPTWAASGFVPRLYFERDSTKAEFAMTFVTDKGFDNGLRFSNAEVVPVYLIEGSDLGRIETAFVPEGERCILVNTGSLDRLFEDFFMTGASALGQHNSFDKALVLSLVLLHEIGHLYFEDGGSYGAPAVLAVDEINQPSAAITSKEVRADRFASEMVNAAWVSQQLHAPIYGPYARATIASNIFRAVAVASNSHDLTVDPQGILDGAPKPDVFRQSGYSHLNLYVRLLVLSQQMDPNEERLKELRWVEAVFRAKRDQKP